MKRFILILLILLLLLAGGLALGLFFAPDRVQQAWSGLGLPAQSFDRLASRAPSGRTGATQPAADGSVIAATGFLEAEETAIVAELGGQALAVLVDQGEAVAAGQPLVRLDDSLLQAQLRQADQAVDSAQAALALAQAGPRPAEIAAAQAQMQQAQASLDGARQSLLDAQAARADPQALTARINAAQSRAALAQRQVEVQSARQAVLRVLRESIANDGSDQGQTQRAIYDQQLAAAAENSAAAQAELQGAQRALNALRQMRANPASADAQVRAAEGQVRLAEQAVAVAEAGLALAAAGPQPEVVAVVGAQVAEAEAAWDVVVAQLAKAALNSPIDGVVLLRAVEPGETVSPGVPLLRIADLNQMTLVVYVPLERIGQVQVGQPARVSVDAYPGRTFDGVVSAIASRAEFTPKNILATEERSEVVVAVTVTLPGGSQQGALKPGMPADVEIGAP